MGQLSPLEDGRIDRAAFAEQLRQATELAVAFAASMVRQRMPAARRYLIEVEASNYPTEHLKGDEQVYLEDNLLAGQTLGPLSLEEAVEWLWRAGKVPVWINIAAYAADRRYTYVRLQFADRFSGQVGSLYYQQPGELPPFGIKSPDLPMGWKSVEQHGRFDLPGQGQVRLKRLLKRTFWQSVYWVRRRLTSAAPDHPQAGG